MSPPTISYTTCWDLTRRGATCSCLGGSRALLFAGASSSVACFMRVEHEVLLIGRRGNIRPPLEGGRPRSVIRAPRREHSRKPDEAYEVIERMFPDAQRLELFSRRRRVGWSG